MKAGAATIDITPPVGVELSGFVARTQPSIGVHDSLAARGLYLDDEADGRLLWIHADVIGFSAGDCDRVRQRLAAATGLKPDQVLVSATHTHSGPPTITLNNCGKWMRADPFPDMVLDRLVEVGVMAAQTPESVQLTFAVAECGLNRDRRGFASAHVDHRCSAIGIRRPNGEYLAVLANYPCHPVSLGGENRRISRDLFGFAADHVSASLPGSPVVLLTNGACGNLNPPRVPEDFSGCEELGRELGSALLQAVSAAEVIDGQVSATGEKFDVELVELLPGAVEVLAEDTATEIRRLGNEWAPRGLAAVEMWKRSMLELPVRRRTLDLRLHAVRIGQLKLACLGAECFSILGEQLRSRCGEPFFVVGYTNGEMGYLCPSPAYDEGGYEVASAFVYYNTPPVKRGEYERAVERLVLMLKAL